MFGGGKIMRHRARSLLLDFGVVFFVLALIGILGYLFVYGGHWLYDAFVGLFN